MGGALFDAEIVETISLIVEPPPPPFAEGPAPPPPDAADASPPPLLTEAGAGPPLDAEPPPDASPPPPLTDAGAGPPEAAFPPPLEEFPEEESPPPEAGAFAGAGPAPLPPPPPPDSEPPPDDGAEPLAGALPLEDEPEELLPLEEPDDELPELDEPEEGLRLSFALPSFPVSLPLPPFELASIVTAFEKVLSANFVEDAIFPSAEALRVTGFEGRAAFTLEVTCWPAFTVTALPDPKDPELDFPEGLDCATSTCP